jgi:hypothetical protein
MLESLLRCFSPFRLMKDVSRGTREERIAAHRFNRRRRGELAVCMRRWVLLLAPAALLTARLDALGGSAAQPRVFAYLAAACATVLACGVCVLFVTGCVYVYLSTHES